MFKWLPIGIVAIIAGGIVAGGSNLDAVYILILILYFVPWLIALMRDHNNIGSILVVNLFLGWTVIGWIVALAWACSDNVKT